jgi:photosystem II stability/assembly factor-like uncharacterized protein
MRRRTGALFAIFALGLSGFIVLSSGAASATQIATKASGIEGLAAVSCSGKACEAVGNANKTDFDAARTTNSTTWAAQDIGVSVTDLRGVDCISATVCYAAGFSPNGNGGPAIVVTKNGGKSWKIEPNPGLIPGQLESISCSSSTDCIAAGWGYSDGVPVSLVIGTTNGTTWTNLTLPNTTSLIWGVSCASSEDCELAGSSTLAEILGTTNGGKTWTVQKLPSIDDGYLYAIDCQSTKDCEAVGTQTVSGSGEPLFLGTTNGGTTWNLQSGTGMTDSLDGVSCASAKDCEAVGGNGTGDPVAFGSTNGGSAWKAQTVPGSAHVYGVSCTTASDCEAAASGNGATPAVLGTTNGGKTWKLQTLS